MARVPRNDRRGWCGGFYLSARADGAPVSTGRIFDIQRLQQLHDAGAPILLRCPMIPSHNARQAHLDGIVALTRKLPKLQGVELLPYYDLWRGKLKRFGLTTELSDSVKPPIRETVKSWNDYLRARGIHVVGCDVPPTGRSRHISQTPSKASL